MTVWEILAVLAIFALGYGFGTWWANRKWVRICAGCDTIARQLRPR